MQRFFDVVFSLLAILVLLPLLVLATCILICTGEHEVLYLQKRIGRGGKEFGIFKFATMIKNSSNIGTGGITIKDDPRVLPFGKFLRKTKINELPQLFNVLFGDMSLIGPRPLMKDSYDAYNGDVKKHINSVRPGLSGVGSIVFRDEEKYFLNVSQPEVFYKTQILPYKGLLEIWFVQHNCLSLYFKLIILTIVSVIVSSSNLYEKLLNDLPQKPSALL